MRTRWCGWPAPPTPEPIHPPHRVAPRPGGHRPEPPHRAPHPDQGGHPQPAPSASAQASGQATAHAPGWDAGADRRPFPPVARRRALLIHPQIGLFAGQTQHNKVARDNTVQYQWRILQLQARRRAPQLRRRQVEVLEHPDGRLQVRHEGEIIPSRPAPPRAGALRASHGALAPMPEISRIVKRLCNRRLRRKLGDAPTARGISSPSRGATIGWPGRRGGRRGLPIREHPPEIPC